MISIFHIPPAPQPCRYFLSTGNFQSQLLPDNHSLSMYSLVLKVRKAAISPLFSDHRKCFDMLFIY